jgi:tetratricopeptide (TPR) repeat protein
LQLATSLVDRSLYPQLEHYNIVGIQRSIDEQMALAHFKRAQDLFSNDDREDAKKELEDALEIISDGPVAFSSRQLLDLIENPAQPSTMESMSFNPSPTRSEIEHLNQLIAKREFEGAIEYLEAMRLRVGIEQQEWLDGRIREIQRAVDYNRYVDQYNLAVELYNNRKYKDVVQVLEALLATLSDGPEAESATALLSDALEALE